MGVIFAQLDEMNEIHSSKTERIQLRHFRQLKLSLLLNLDHIALIYFI